MTKPRLDLKNEKHGDTGTRMYRIYWAMLNRCYLPKQTGYEHYGGRGITVCKEWRDSYLVFKHWALEHGYSDTLTLDREEVNGAYEPNNCRWVSLITQARNRRAGSAGTSTYIGVSMCRKTGKWVAMIKIDRKQKNLGRYTTELEAAKARDQYILDNNLKDFTMNGVLP